MTQVNRHSQRRSTLVAKQARLIRIQWLIILALLVGLVIAISVKVAANESPVTAMGSAVTETAKPSVTPEPTSEPAPPLAPEPTYLGEFKLTAYCACEKCCGKKPDHPAYGITKSGTRATAGRTIAVDPKVIPLGSEVIINGHTYVAEDTGGAIKSNRLDIYFDSHQEALNFGVQYANVYLNTTSN